MKMGWYFSDEMSPSDKLVDEFTDSKFGIDRWDSFAREIIQNSMDAQDDESRPVEVVFDLNKELALTDIPGGEYVKDVLTRCEGAATNKHTKGAYKKGLEILSKEKVYCLKISDRNTKGVKTGRDEAWGAFVFDEGKSVKMRPGAAGSHGVGKKVPFIISSCNTVFYATKNKYEIDGEEKSDCLVQGKTTLINWVDDDNKRKSNKGWFGLVDGSADTKNIVKPIEINENEEERVNPYFIRNDEYGTDVIIIGVNLYENEDEIKKHIISAILENFFVGIMGGKLVVNVFGESVSADSFERLVKKYYIDKKDTKNDLEGCLRVYKGTPDEEIEIYDNYSNYTGKIKIYFGLGNRHNRKYYTIVRSHGMRISDNRVNKAGQPYTAVVIIEGEDLNKLLAGLENAAHDDFVTEDENIELDPNAIYVYEVLTRKIKDYIIQKTKIDETEGQTIDGLSNIISIPGMITSVKKNSKQRVIKHNTVTRKGMGAISKDYEGKSKVGIGVNQSSKSSGGNKPAKPGEDFESILFEDYIMEPVLIKTGDDYLLKLQVAQDVKNADIVIHSINDDDKTDDSINAYIDCAYINGTRRKCVNGKIKGVMIPQGKIMSIVIKLKYNVMYQLTAKVYSREAVTNE